MTFSVAIGYFIYIRLNDLLAKKGTPMIMRWQFKILKIELINGSHYPTLEQLSLELFDYVNWYNNIRTHSTLGYLSPV